jgi:hypothetical protein
VKNDSNNYIYHRVPDEIAGDTLFPLNKLKDIYPKEYQQQVEKYNGREYLLERKIPCLECLWNDVLHLTAIDPNMIFQTLRKIGFKYPTHYFYKIEFSDLNVSDCVEMIYFGEDREYRKVDPLKFPKVNELPNATIEYYTNCWKEKVHPLLFYGIPHILYKGTINVIGKAIIEV